MKYANISAAKISLKSTVKNFRTNSQIIKLSVATGTHHAPSPSSL